jgi:ribonuclease D
MNQKLIFLVYNSFVCLANSSENLNLSFHQQSVPNVPWLKRSFDGPATVQLATVDAALVLHLVDNNGTPSDSSAPILREFLADKSFVKVGIGIDQDMLELYRLWGCSFDVHNRFDIGGIGSMDVRTTLSLKSLTKAVAKVELQKTRKLAMSNWSKVPLQIPQIAYAARDAWASAAILDQLAEKDPSKFSSEALIKLILTDELSMKELDTRAKGRKLAKTKLQEILGKGPTKVSRQNLSEDQRIEVLTMEKVLRDLAPPPLYRIDLGSLGF